MASMQELQLIRRPDGFPKPEDFALIDVDPVPLQPGEFTVRNVYLSVDPYMRQLMDSGWPIRGKLTSGRAIGIVEQTESARFAPGEIVFHNSGWSTHAVLSESTRGVRSINPAPGVLLSSYLSALGGTGLTAYVGLRTILDVREGDVVFLTSVAGGVGVAAAQIARLLGAATVLGATGDDAKAQRVRERFGVDAVANYRTEDLDAFLGAHANDGLTATLDGVGGSQLELAIKHSRRHARIALVGAISQYHTGTPWSPPANFEDIHFRALTVSGYAVADYGRLQNEYEDFLVPHLASGAFKDEITVYEGFKRTPEAFLDVLSGATVGKGLVQASALPRTVVDTVGS